MAVTDWKSPGTLANVARNGYDEWVNPGYAAASDNDRAHAAAAGYSDYLRATNFGFTLMDIPAGSVITKIEAGIKRVTDWVHNAVDEKLYLRNAGGLEGDNKADTVTNWPCADGDPLEEHDAYAYYEWDNTEIGSLSLSDILSSGFGVDFSAYGSSGEAYLYVNHIKLRVTYTPPSLGAFGAVV